MAIKHLTGRTEQELQQIFKKLPPKEKLVEGLNNHMIWLVKEAVDEIDDFLHVFKTIYNACTWIDDSYHKNHPYKIELFELFETLKNNKDAIREALKGQPALDRLRFARNYNVDWLFKEIQDNEEELISQEELAEDFYEFERENPLFVLKQIKRAFDYTEEQGFSISYKVVSDKVYQVTLSQNIYLSDEVEDIVIEDEQPITLTVKINIDIVKLLANYDFAAKYQNGAYIGHDEDLLKINKRTMGKEFETHLEYIVDDVTDKYDQFKKDILDLVETTHKESEEYSDEKYYPALDESIKHLTGRTEQEIRQKLKNLSPKEKLETGAKEGIVWLVKDAIAAGADVHARDDYALRLASNYGHVEVVQLLLDAGADVHAENDLALRWASGNGHAEVVKLLLGARADVHARDDCALRWASYYGNVEVVKLLLAAGANVHADDDYALRYASGNGHVEVVKLLLDAGADVHTDNDIALLWASNNGHAEVVKLLKQHGAKLVNESIKHLTGRTEEEIRQKLKNLSPEDKLEAGILLKDLSLVKKAAKEGVDFTAYITSKFLYPLSYAIIYNAGDDIIDFICKHTHSIERLRVGLNWAREENNKKWAKILKSRISRKENEKNI